MSTLVFLEHHDGEIQKGSLGVLAKAASLGDADAVLVGEGVRGLAADAARHGAEAVHVADDASLAAPLSQPRVDVLAKLAAAYDAVLFANSVLAADVAAGLAARLDAGLNWDLVDITADFVYMRWMGADRDIVDYSRIQIDRSRELELWAGVISQLAKRGRSVYGYVNNHFAGHSPSSARELQRMLHLSPVDPEQLGEQMTLF